MREIKFRGKRIDCNVWVVGYFEITWSVQLGKSTRRHWINVNTEFSYDEKYEVHVESVGEYTALKDKNGKDIYEGDMVSAIYEWESYHPDSEDYDTKTAINKGEVIFDNGQWKVKGEIMPLYKWDNKTLEIIGDIYTTPELLTNKNK